MEGWINKWRSGGWTWLLLYFLYSHLVDQAWNQGGMLSGLVPESGAWGAVNGVNSECRAAGTLSWTPKVLELSVWIKRETRRGAGNFNWQLAGPDIDAKKEAKCIALRLYSGPVEMRPFEPLRIPSKLDT
ncbi:hypothetical protein B0T10DRAFT_454782 [Thelonectria olida]|uniref:Uncharacterized protein n=1 Tax=Thelonectria olida TaxID=1576542 RepID=A0A9P8WHB7_9HYPO|nr:hypothetical protein B0T10DRAFT_454782 [Thelonectria olida]